MSYEGGVTDSVQDGRLIPNWTRRPSWRRLATRRRPNRGYIQHVDVLITHHFGRTLQIQYIQLLSFFYHALLSHFKLGVLEHPQYIDQSKINSAIVKEKTSPTCFANDSSNLVALHPTAFAHYFQIAYLITIQKHLLQALQMTVQIQWLSIPPHLLSSFRQPILLAIQNFGLQILLDYSNIFFVKSILEGS